MMDSWIHTIPGWLTPHEGNFLSKAALFVGSKKEDIVEIGSYMGKSTIYLALSSSHVTAIDPHRGNFSGGTSSPTYAQFKKNLTRAGIEDRVSPIVATSKVASRSWKRPIALLFIDGLHDEKSATEDVVLWAPFVVSGGIVAMHDAFCGWHGAGVVAMKHIVRSDDYCEIGVVGSIIFGVKGKTSEKQRIIKLFISSTIELCQRIYTNRNIPNWVRYILVHKLLRLLLLNRFSTIFSYQLPNPTRENPIG